MGCLPQPIDQWSESVQLLEQLLPEVELEQYWQVATLALSLLTLALKSPIGPLRLFEVSVPDLRHQSTH